VRYQGGTVAQGVDAERAHEGEIVLPAIVMAGFLHFVDAHGLAVRPGDHRVAAFDPCRK
jgi:hypothetical protein